MLENVRHLVELLQEESELKETLVAVRKEIKRVMDICK